MIRKTSHTDRLLQRLDDDPIGNIYPRAILQGYPRDDAFYRAFEGDDGVVLTTGHTAYISGAFDKEELRHFLTMLGIKEIIYPHKDGNKHILVYRGSPQTSTACYAQESDMRGIWQLLCKHFENMPDYRDYYQTKTAQRLYLGGKTAVVRDGERIASTASVLVCAKDYALLGAVATDTAYRKQGHAGNLLRLLISEVLEHKKTPLILCDNPIAIHLYKSMGFEEYGKMTVKPYVF